MKKLTKLLALVVSFAAISLTACSNLVDDAEIEGEGIKASSERTLTVIATGSTDSVVFPERQSGRTILPDALVDTNLSFYLWGKNLLNTSDTSINTPKKVDFYATSGSNGREGSVELDLPVSQYILYLAAVDKTVLSSATSDENTVKSKAVLYAAATADMRYNEKVSFYLTPYFDNGRTGNGSVNLTLKLTEALTGITEGNVSFGMYDLLTDQLIAGSGGTTTNKAIIVPDSTAFADFNDPEKGTTYKITAVKPDTYNFKVIFTKGTKNYVWSDLIYVLPNQETTKTIVIDNIIGKPATKPEKFTARFTEPENTWTDVYDVQFLWEDKSNNEKFFQIDVLEAPEDFTGTSYASADGWTGASASYVSYKTDSTEDIVAGSLAANSTMVVLRMKLGKRYIARISACNDADNDEYTYMDLTNSTAVAQQYTRLSTTIPTTDLKSFDSNTINRYRVTYNLNGGRYYAATYATSTKSITPGVGTANQTNIKTLNGQLDADVRYYSQPAGATTSPATAGYAVLNPLLVADAATGSNTEYALYNDGKQFSGWKINDIDGKTVWKIVDDSATKPWKKITGTGDAEVAGYYVSTASGSVNYEYKGYENLNLFATYDASARVVIYDPADYQITDADVFVGTTTNINGSYAQASKATLGPAKNFTVDIKTETGGIGTVLIGLNNKNYYKVGMTVRQSGTSFTKDIIGTQTQSIAVSATYEVATSYVAGTTYYYNDSGTWKTKTGVDENTVFSGNDIYIMKTAAGTSTFTMFSLPVRTSYAPSQTYIITLEGYTTKNAKVPFTYPITMHVENTGSSTPAVTTVNVSDAVGSVAKDGADATKVAFTWTTAPTEASLSYLWQTSTDSTNGTDGTWTDVGSASTTNAPTAGTATNWYRMKVTGTGTDTTTYTSPAFKYTN